MAEQKKENKENKILTIFTKEYRFEGIFLLVLATIAIILGILVVIGEATSGSSGLLINDDVFLIGDYPLAFAWILIIIGVLSAVVAVWPFYKPSIQEVKSISWTKGTQLLRSVGTVFSFILILALFFLLADTLYGYLVDWFEELSKTLRL